MGIRTRNEPVTIGERAFMIASTLKAMEEGDTPVKVRNFSSKPLEGGNE